MKIFQSVRHVALRFRRNYLECKTEKSNNRDENIFNK